MTELPSVVKVILEYGVLGALCIVCVTVLYYRERAYLTLYSKYATHLAQTNATKLRLLTNVLDTVQAMKEACANCPYRKFVERLAGSAEEGD